MSGPLSAPSARADSADLVARVRRRLARDGAFATDDELRGALDAEPALLADDAQSAILREVLSAELAGAGPLQGLLAEPGVTDVLVNGSEDIWVEGAAGLVRAPLRFADDGQVRALAQRLAAAAGRRLDDAAPYVDVPLPDGTRLHAVLPPLTASPTICLRVVRRVPFGLDELVAGGLCAPGGAALLRAVVQARLAMLISGGTGTGKTTLLSALLSEADPSERVLIIEDVPELAPKLPHVVRLVVRHPNIEGAGGIGPEVLVRQALRMRPDRIVVGEFRGAEVVELLAALNTGHEGGAATLHANSAAAVPARIEALGSLAGATRAAILSQLTAAIDVVLHLRRERDGVRRLAQIGVLRRESAEVVVTPAWQSDGGDAPGRAALEAVLADRGVVLPGVDVDGTLG